MKINFSNFVKLFLAGASLLAVGCTDYGQDIQNLRDDMNDRFDALQTETIDPLRADLTKVQQELAAAQEDIKAQAEKHEQDLKTLQGVDAELQKQIDTNVTAINELKGELNDAVAKLEEAIKNGDDALAAKINETKQELTTLIEGHVEDLQKKIDAINTEITDLKNVDADLQEQITKLADDLKTTNANVAANAKAIATNTTDIAANKKAIEDLNAALDSHVAEFVAYKAEVAGLIAAVNAEIAILHAKDAEIEGLIAKLDERLKANEELAAQNAKDIAANKAEFDAYVAATAETLRLMQEAHDALATRVGNLENDLQSYKEAIRKELDEHYAAFAEYQKKVAEDFAAVNETLKTQADAIAANAAAIEANKAAIADNAAAIAALDLRLTTLEEAHAELAEKHKKLQDDFDAYVAKTEEVIASIQAEQLEQNNTLKLHAQQIADLDQAVKDLDAKVDAIKAELEQKIADLKKTLQDQIDAIKGDLSALKARIQSIVFVPQHVDGKATVKWAEILGDNQNVTIVEGRSTLLYQVYPAECAAAITADELEFVFTGELATSRATEPTFTVVDVATIDAENKPLKAGVIAVTFDARNLGQSFYEGKATYAVSLVFNGKTGEKDNEKSEANIASAYTTLAPATSDALDVKLINDKYVNPKTNDQYTIEYVNTKEKVVVLPDHKYAFSINGEGAYTIEGMLEKGYAVTVQKAAPTYAVNDAQLPNVFLNDVNDANQYLNFVTVSIDPNKVTKDSVGLVETVTYSYNVCGKTLTASADVRIVKIQREIEMKGADIVWTYSQDAMSDAGLELTNSTDVATIVSHTLPDDVTYENVLAVTPTITVTAEGQAASNVQVVFAGTNTEPTIALSNFEWGKTYTITALYELSSIDVTLTATVNTIDRLRTPVVYDLSKDQWQLTKAFVNDGNVSKTKPEDLEALLAILEGDDEYTNYDLTAAKLLEDIFVKKTKTEVNKANGEEEATTKLQFVNNGSQIESVYALADYTPNVPAAIDYVYEVTTWYGQKFTFKKNLNIGLTAVAHALNDENKTIGYQLEFQTQPAESLAPVYDNLLAQTIVTVDKNDFTADEYLKLIFVDKKADNLAEKNLANNEERTGTQLVLDATAGNTAFASYTYKDFTETPKTVVYTYNYTTWYGQVITVTKKVTLELPLFDFVRNDKWVFTEPISFSNPNEIKYYYSNVLAWYEYADKDVNRLNIFSTQEVNMNTAFNVAPYTLGENGEKVYGEIIQTADLGMYNLSTEFKIVAGQNVKLSKVTNNQLAYLDYNLTNIDMIGYLYLSTGIGTEKLQLPTEFDEGGIYDDYTVKRHEFIQDFYANPVSLVLNNADVYRIEIPSLVTITDVRPSTDNHFSLLQYQLDDPTVWYNTYAELQAALKSKPGLTIADINYRWTNGDGTVNTGFEVGRNADAVYSVKFDVVPLNEIPENLKPQVTFANGILTVDASSQLHLTSPQTFKYRVDLIFTPSGASEGVVYKPYEKECIVSVTIAPGN